MIPIVDVQEDPVDPQHLTTNIWDAQVPDNLKCPSLAMFDGKSDPYEHIYAINKQLIITWDTYSLKYKLVSRTSKELSIQWYMSLLRFSVTNYQDLTKKTIHKFSTNKHKKVSTIRLFNVTFKLKDVSRGFSEVPKGGAPQRVPNAKVGVLDGRNHG